MRWTSTKVELLRKFYGVKDVRELAKIIGATPKAVKQKAVVIGIAKGKHHKGIKSYNEIDFYAPGPSTIKEKEGRKITHNIQGIKSYLAPQKEVRLKEYVSPKNGYAHKKGKVIGRTDDFIILQTKNYKECFMFADILSRKTIVEGLDVC